MFVGLLGVAYYAEIHYLVYFIMIQLFVGIFEVSTLAIDTTHGSLVCAIAYVHKHTHKQIKYIIT